MNESSKKDLIEWQERIKEKWDEQRKQIIFEGNGGIIYPTTPTTQSTPQYSTRQTTTTVNLTTHGSDTHEHETGTADAENLFKIGITIPSLLAVIIISLIIIRVSRRYVKNKDKSWSRLISEHRRISLRRPLQSEDTDHIYTETDPLRTNDIESPSTSSGAVPLPAKKEKTRLGVSSITHVSMLIGRLFGTESRRSATNDPIFFSKQSEYLQAPPLPSLYAIPKRDRKGKRRASRQKLDNEASKEKDFAEDSSKGEHDIDQKDSKVYGSNVDTDKTNNSSDDYMEPIKLKTFSEYLEINPLVPETTTSKQHSQLKEHLENK